ncbi:MAG TPA: hypothetical protein VGO53_16180 [Steroidobacteraceae bacterium]|jgi:hypothetical protein|nr:hypothetical protein [Steroidobacteraceae bacterium]
MATTIEALTSSDDGDASERPCGCGAALEVQIETMPRQHRDSHTKAGNRGVYPLNCAERYGACLTCARLAVEADPEWTSIVGEGPGT